MKKILCIVLVFALLLSSAVFAENVETNNDEINVINPRYAVTWPTASRVITSPFGWRTIFGQPDFHLGVDIQADVGTDVVAVAGGTIKYSADKGLYGNLICLNSYITVYSGEGPTPLAVNESTIMRQSRYAHLDRFIETSETTVNRGQLIAESGNTGLSTGAHLHFEMRTINSMDDLWVSDSNAHNPLIYFRGENFTYLGIMDRFGVFHCYESLITYTPEQLRRIDAPISELMNFLNDPIVQSNQNVNFSTWRQELLNK